MRMETFIRKALGLKAHTVVKVEEDETAGGTFVAPSFLKLDATIRF